jgi:hypothetical protein
MPTECTDLFKSWVFRSSLVVAAFASIAIQPAAAQSNAHRASNWGAMFASQVSRCWIKPEAAGNNAAEAVFKIRLTEAGRLAEEPSLDSSAASGYARAYQQSALRAINECQPYTLPIEHYDEWKYFMPVFSGSLRVDCSIRAVLRFAEGADRTKCA